MKSFAFKLFSRQHDYFSNLVTAPVASSHLLERRDKGIKLISEIRPVFWQSVKPTLAKNEVAHERNGRPALQK